MIFFPGTIIGFFIPGWKLFQMDILLTYECTVIACMHAYIYIYIYITRRTTLTFNRYFTIVFKVCVWFWEMGDKYPWRIIPHSIVTRVLNVCNTHAIACKYKWAAPTGDRPLCDRDQWPEPAPSDFIEYFKISLDNGRYVACLSMNLSQAFECLSRCLAICNNIVMVCPERRVS